MIPQLLATGTLLGVPLIAIPATTEQSQPTTFEAAMQVAQREADCADCNFRAASKRPAESARRGLANILIMDANGISGYMMTLGYTGQQWQPLWEGNGSTRNAATLPGRIAICMIKGGSAIVRSGPGPTYRPVGKVDRPTIKKAFQLQLTRPVGRREGVGWYRISYQGQPAWVENLSTIDATRGSAGEQCTVWRASFDKPQRYY